MFIYLYHQFFYYLLFTPEITGRGGIPRAIGRGAGTGAPGRLTTTTAGAAGRGAGTGAPG